MMETVTPAAFMKSGEFSSMCPILLQKPCDRSVKFSQKKEEGGGGKGTEEKKTKTPKPTKLIESVSLFLALRIYFRQFQD